MLIAVIRYIIGYLKIRIEGYSPERFLNLCSHYGIYLWDLRPSSHAYEMNISVRGFRKLKPIIRKTRTKVIITERHGFPFFIHKYRKRKLFFAGILFCVLCIYVMSLFVWNIHIDGNSKRTDEVLLEFLENKGIKHGMRKSGIDCERIVKDIRKEYDDIIWVSAYIEGTRLMIQVKENTDRTMVEEDTDAEESVTNPIDIVAEKDGTILNIITRNGVPLVHEGDSVKKGDILVSGTVEVLNDAKEVVGYQYQEADADIVAQTSFAYDDTMPLQYEEKEWTEKKKYAIWMETEENVYFLGKQSGGYKNFVKESKIFRLKIGESFWIPFSFGLQTISEYKTNDKKYTENEYQTRLTQNFQKFCANLEKKGVQILENNVKIYRETAQVSAKGTLTLSEPVGISIAGEKSELPKSDDTVQQEGN